MTRTHRRRDTSRGGRKRAGLDSVRVAAIVVMVLVLAALAWTLRHKPQATSGARSWSQPPSMSVDPGHKYQATIKMEKGGEFTIELYPDKAPLAVNSFVFLARQGYFDGLTFHRVIDGFMAQGGDPTGTGTGGPGYQFANEDNDLTFNSAGVVAMANAGRDTNGSQFFVTFGPQPRLDGGYTIFGQVTSGFDVVNSLTRRDPTQNPSFSGDAMATVTVSEK